MCLFLWKNNILRCWGLTFCSKLDWGCYIISIAKTASKKIGALIRSMKFLSHEVALYLYKSIIQPCRTVGPSLAASLEPLGHRRNLASLSLFSRNYFGRCSLELPQLVPPPYSQGRSTRNSEGLHDFFVTIPTRVSMSKVSLLA